MIAAEAPSMTDYENEIRSAVESYQGEHKTRLAGLPFVYRLFTRLLESPELPGRLRPLLLAALAYFMLPVDVISEDITGPRGFFDDLFLGAFVLGQVANELGSWELLEGQWEGPGTVQVFAGQVLSSEQALIADQRDVILWYIGYEHLEKVIAQ
jgi:uncharacterized membrane protein YkvA (DUF1232 family)